MKSMFRVYGLKVGCLLIGLSLLLSACGGQSDRTSTPSSPPLDLRSLLPQDGTLSGWSAITEPATFNRENLYSLVNGQADSFFAYGFEQVATQRYQNAEGVYLNVEIWQLATFADAYGLFHAGRAGQPTEIGIEGDADPGRRLAFWQERYFVSVNASAAIPDETLRNIANTLATRLPSGGSPPALLARLPDENLVAGSVRFFHEEISIQNDLWLGGENLLGLNQQTNGLLARYNLNGETVILLLIEYPDPQQAEAARVALQASGMDDFLAAQSRENRLAALFGAAEATFVNDLLVSALK